MRFPVSVGILLASVTIAGCTTGMQPGVKPVYSSAPSSVRQVAKTPPVIGGNDIFDLGAAPADTRTLAVPTAGAEKDKGAGVSPVRAMSLREAGMVYGSQAGEAEATYKIMKKLQAHSGSLSTIFNFRGIVEDSPIGGGVIVPPVVVRGTNAVTISPDGREAAVSDEFLVIKRPGRIAALEPTWRDYLLWDVSKPKPPALSLRPKDKAEEEIFRDAMQDGIRSGYAVAAREIGDRLDRLRVDFEGMLQYRQLVKQGMVDQMVLADADFGVTSDGTKMNIGNRTVKITKDAAFQSDPQKWQVHIVRARHALIVGQGSIPPLDFDFGFE